ncbi:hypothetical protein GOV09_07185 [Candidatus Woesearchaeota archaeon]|nr:hypothetical protein [Candidatus Woesearchaeota archaeon]
MIESYKQAIEEFKRVDHLYFVTLKYTRTVDVLRSTVERLISTYQHAVDAVLKCMKEEKAIPELPDSPVARAELLKEKVTEENIVNYLDTYLMLRRLMRFGYTKREEYRRHVTMVVDFEGEPLNVDIDLLKEYYDQARDMLRYVKSKVESYVDEPT